MSAESIVQLEQFLDKLQPELTEVYGGDAVVGVSRQMGYVALVDEYLSLGSEDRLIQKGEVCIVGAMWMLTRINSGETLLKAFLEISHQTSNRPQSLGLYPRSVWNTLGGPDLWVNAKAVLSDVKGVTSIREVRDGHVHISYMLIALNDAGLTPDQVIAHIKTLAQQKSEAFVTLEEYKTNFPEEYANRFGVTS